MLLTESNLGMPAATGWYEKLAVLNEQPNFPAGR